MQVVSIRSSLIPLDTAAMTLLVNSQFQVEVHGQRVGVDEAPMLLGQAAVPLSSVITGLPGLDAYFPLGENNGGGKIRVRVYLDDELARMAAGSSLLQVHHAWPINTTSFDRYRILAEPILCAPPSPCPPPLCLLLWC